MKHEPESFIFSKGFDESISKVEKTNYSKIKKDLQNASDHSVKVLQKLKR